MLRIRPFIAELIGTFCVVFLGAGAVITNSFAHGDMGWFGIGLVQGLILFAMISAFAPVSGGHFNPAVSLGMWIAKKISRPTLITYVICQILGAVLAGLLLRVIFPSTVWETAYLGAPHLNIGVGAALLVESLLGFFWMLAFMGTVADPMAPKLGGLGVGATVAAGTMFAGPLTGAAMNPVRALGPALAANYWDAHWIFWIAPVIGASLAAWIYPRWISETI